MENSSLNSVDAGAVDHCITTLIQKMLDRKPPGTIITLDVCIKLLSGKYAEKFPGVDFKEKSGLIKAYLEKKQAPVRSSKRAENKPSDSDSDSDSDDSSDSSEEDEESDEESDEYETDDEEDDGEAAEKKPRVEGTTKSRIEGMLECLKKLRYTARPIDANGNESEDDYLTKYLVPVFQSKKLDPLRYSAKDIQRYKLQKEAAELESNGADVSLNRSQRQGRGIPPPPPPPPSRPAFLDD